MKITIDRILNLDNLLSKKSYFLFGPRAVGKSFLIRQALSDKALIIDLLKSDYSLRLSQNPGLLESLIDENPAQYVVIDEVQKVPPLLDEVHRLIEEKGITFLLTGSSARKLKRGKANMLAGRAREAKMFPLVSAEILDFDLKRYLKFGGLPSVYLSDDPLEDLQSYVQTYLREEIQAEALIKNLPAFSRFLETSALTSGSVMNFTQISNDTGIPASSIREYYFTLEETFIGFMVQPFQKTLKRKAISTAKFYYFDIGVKNYLAKIDSIPEQSNLYGMAFEHFVAMELNAYISYKRLINKDLTFWQEKNGKEVDFIIGSDLAIEVKTTQKVQDKHLKGMKFLMEENIVNHYILVSFDKLETKQNGIHCMHWETFLKKLWSGKLLDEKAA